MTSSILLGSKEEQKLVCAAAEACDFKCTYTTHGGAVYVHRNITDLRLQIHRNARHFRDVAGIVTQVEFDDLTDRFPDHPKAIETLRELHIVMPDLLYRNNAVFITDLKPPKPLSEYIAELEK